MHGSSSEKWFVWVFVVCVTHFSCYHGSRAQVLYCAMVAGYDNVHLRSNIPRLAEAVQFGNGAGDRCAVFVYRDRQLLMVVILEFGHVLRVFTALLRGFLSVNI